MKKLVICLLFFISFAVNAQNVELVDLTDGFVCSDRFYTYEYRNPNLDFNCYTFSWSFDPSSGAATQNAVTSTDFTRVSISFSSQRGFVKISCIATRKPSCGGHPTVTSPALEVQINEGADPVSSDITFDQVRCGSRTPVKIKVKRYNPSSLVSYNWTLPQGWTISSSFVNEISVIPSGNTSGNVSVSVTFPADYLLSMGCSDVGFSAPLIRSTTRQITLDPPALTGITGQETLAWGDRSIKTYTTSDLSNASYEWNIPCGWVTSGGQTSVFVTSSRSIQVVPNGYTAGTIFVSGRLLCNGVNSVTLTSAISIAIGSGTPTVSGPNVVCSTGNFTLNSSPDPVSWVVSPAIVSPASGSGSNAVFSKVSNGPATITYIFSYCGVNQSWSKNFHLGPYSSSNYPISGPANASCNSYVYYNIPQLSDVTSINWTWPSGWTYVSGQGTAYLALRTGRYSGTVGVGVNNSCGSSGSYYTLFTYVSGFCGYSLVASPNPASSELELTLVSSDQDENASNRGAQDQRMDKPIESQIVLYNLRQEAVYRGTSKNKKTVISLAGIPKGVYVLKVAVADQVLEKQILVEK